MKQLIVFFALLCNVSAAFCLTKVVKEGSFHLSSVTSVAASSQGGHYVVSKYEGDSVVIRVSLECKDMEAYNSFMIKHGATLTNNSGNLKVRTEKVSSGIGTLLFEIFIPADLPLEITSEKSQISIKEMKLNLKLFINDGVLFADNISGKLTISSEKMDMDIKSNNLEASINTKNSDISFTSKSGSLKLSNNSGKTKVTLLTMGNTEVFSNSGDIQLFLPKTANCMVEASSDKKPILLGFEDIELNGNITANSLKVKISKGGSETLKLSTQSGNMYIGNVAILSK